MSSALAPSSPQHEALAQAFRAAGALSPATAQALHEIAGVDAADVVTLAARGIVREAAPGRFYWYTGGVHEKRERALTAILIGGTCVLVVVGLPLAVWLLSR